jgi:uncharacterized cupredoxin-like copper-binding protein
MTAAPTGVPDPHGPRRPLREEVRGMRTTLLAVGGLIVVIVAAVVIGLVTYDTGASAPVGDVQATTVDYAVHMPTKLTTGKHTIGLTNRGSEGHEIVIFKTDLPADALPVGADGDVIEDAPSLTTVGDSGDALAPGRSKSFTTDALTPGHYTAVCNLPGHYRLGMHLDVTVK